MIRKQASFKEDSRRGMKAERDFVIMMSTKYNLKITKMSKFHFSDFISEEKKILFELKRRNNNRKSYKYTIIGYDKITRFNTYNDKHNNLFLFVMVFKFNDGTYFFIHNNKYKYLIKPYVRHQRSDYVDKKKNYVFLPVDELIPIIFIKNYIDHKILVRYNF